METQITMMILMGMMNMLMIMMMLVMVVVMMAVAVMVMVMAYADDGDDDGDHGDDDDEGHDADDDGDHDYDDDNDDDDDCGGDEYGVCLRLLACLSACLLACLSGCLSVCLFGCAHLYIHTYACVGACRYVCMHGCMSYSLCAAFCCMSAFCGAISVPTFLPTQDRSNIDNCDGSSIDRQMHNEQRASDKCTTSAAAAMRAPGNQQHDHRHAPHELDDRNPPCARQPRPSLHPFTWHEVACRSRSAHNRC